MFETELVLRVEPQAKSASFCGGFNPGPGHDHEIGLQKTHLEAFYLGAIT
jgi:hypothetical protein